MREPTLPELIVTVPGLADELRRRYDASVEKWTAINVPIMRRAKAARSVAEVKPGLRAMPQVPDWMRGPGRVDRIDGNGDVWVVFPPREGVVDPSSTVTCVEHWSYWRYLEPGT